MSSWCTVTCMLVYVYSDVVMTRNKDIYMYVSSDVIMMSNKYSHVCQ